MIFVKDTCRMVKCPLSNNVNRFRLLKENIHHRSFLPVISIIYAALRVDRAVVAGSNESASGYLMWQ